MIVVFKRFRCVWSVLVVASVMYVFLYTRDLLYSAVLVTNEESPPLGLPPWASEDLLLVAETAAWNLSQSGISCQFPKLSIFPTNLLQFLNQEPPELKCENSGHLKWFDTTTDSVPLIVPAVSKEIFEQRNVTSCCVRSFKRRHGNDYRVKYSSHCFPISLKKPTHVPDKKEFWTVECIRAGEEETVEILTSVPDNLSVKQGLNATVKDKMNVMVLFIDACSRLSLIRTMPKIYKFLTVNLTAVDMEMYHKVGESTIGNLLPLLANQKMNGSLNAADCEKDGRYDDCPFIWKQFKKAGYRTLYAEDTFTIANFQRDKYGFRNQPTDHYFRTFATAIDDEALAHDERYMTSFCFGSRPAYETVLKYVEQVAVSLQRLDKPLFQFVFLSSLTHDLVNGGRLLEDGLLEWLERLHSMNYFNNTILLFGSDHGSRVSSIAGHYQSFVEDRHPFMLVALPPAFRRKYSKEYKKLKENSKRLVTPWDVHQTLRGVLNLAGNTEKTPPNHTGTGGISLLASIPKNRTCEDALIPHNYCTCNLNFKSISMDSVIVGKCIEQMFQVFEKKLESDRQSCETLELEDVVFAEKAVSELESEDGLYRLVIRTKPDALFEGLVTVGDINGNKTFEVDHLARQDLYGKRSNCVQSFFTKPYCICKDLKNKDFVLDNLGLRHF